jgi:phytanoyl-CoA hydroxylase
MELTSEQLLSYRQQGFLMLEGLFDQDVLTRWSAHFEALVLGDTPMPEKMKVMQDVMVAKGAIKPASPLHAINKILSFEHDPIFWEYAVDVNLLDAVRSIVGPELITISTNVFNKPPGVDGRHPLHQDLRYFALRPADKIVATWTAIDPCTRENGCLAVIPGSHLAQLHWHDVPDWEHVNSGFFALEDVDIEARVHFEMAPGDTLLFHPLLVHGSGRNRSDGFRRAISAHYASVDCERPDEPRKRPAVVKAIPSASDVCP